MRQQPDVFRRRSDASLEGFVKLFLDLVRNVTAQAAKDRHLLRLRTGSALASQSATSTKGRLCANFPCRSKYVMRTGKWFRVHNVRVGLLRLIGRPYDDGSFAVKNDSKIINGGYNGS